MEVNKFLKEKLKDKRGSTFFIFIMLIMVLLVVMLCVMEYFRVMELHDTVTTEMERAANMALEYSMIDEARSYHISQVDVDITKEQFDMYFTERLELNDQLEKYVDGQRQYQVKFNSLEIHAEIPQITMQGSISIDLQLINKYMPEPVELPFDIKTRNVNMED